jgi:hypothetical protein
LSSLIFIECLIYSFKLTLCAFAAAVICACSSPSKFKKIPYLSSCSWVYTRGVFDSCSCCPLLGVVGSRIAGLFGQNRFPVSPVSSTEEVRLRTAGSLSCVLGLHRFVRLTNAFSKKWENHWSAVGVWCCWCNFGRSQIAPHDACKAGISDQIWSVPELLEN